MTGVKYLLDTNIIIGMYQRNKPILEIVQAKNIKNNECAYSAITRMELLSFPKITDPEYQAIDNLLRLMTYFPITTEIENIAIKFRRETRMKLPDAIIAATSIERDVELLTMDEKLSNCLRP